MNPASPLPAAAIRRAVQLRLSHLAPGRVLAAAFFACALSVRAGEPAPAAAVRLTDDATLASVPGLVCFKIETDIATYYLEKSGAGLAAMIDCEGNDWIGFGPEPGSRGNGEFRGFPNAVHQQAGNYFHPRNAGTDPSDSRVVSVEPGHVAIDCESENRLWACRYDFYPTHCTFTMTRMAQGRKYWALYEGTPGGRLDDTDWWITSAISDPQPIEKNHEGDIPAPEWIAFGDAGLKRVLFLLHHEDDDKPDRYYPMKREMTVFGFGRDRGGKFIESTPQRFSIGFVESTDADVIRHTIEKQVLKP